MPNVSRVKGGPRAWALALVSSDKQSESIPHQVQWARDTAARQGWDLAHIIDDVASGKKGPRQPLARLLRELEALPPEGRPEWVMLTRADRIGRGSIVDSQIVVRDLRALGVRLFTGDRGEIKHDTAMDELVSSAMFALSRRENEIRSEKLRGNYERRRRAGLVVANKRPYGLKMVNGRDEADEPLAQVVREAFRLRIAGKGYHVIGNHLAAIAPPRVFKSVRKGEDGVVQPPKSLTVRWTATRVMRLLSNHAYVGPIIDEATFALAQRARAAVTAVERKASKSRRWPWPLAGVLRCFCGRMLVGIACGSEPRRIRYYACRAKWNHNVSLLLTRADRLEEQFLSLLGEMRSSRALMERFQNNAVAPDASRHSLGQNLKTLRADLAGIDRKRDTAWELHVQGKVRSEDVQERLDALAEQRTELEHSINAVTTQLALAVAVVQRRRDARDLLRRATEIFTNGQEPEQRDIARALGVAIGGLYVGVDGTLEVGAVCDTAAQRRPR